MKWQKDLFPAICELPSTHWEKLAGPTICIILTLFYSFLIFLFKFWQEMHWQLRETAHPWRHFLNFCLQQNWIHFPFTFLQENEIKSAKKIVKVQLDSMAWKRKIFIEKIAWGFACWRKWQGRCRISREEVAFSQQQKTFLLDFLEKTSIIYTGYCEQS